MHPLFGAVCLLALVNAASGFVEHDTMSGRVLHDAHRFSGGHINLKPFGQTLMTRWLLGELTPIPRDQFVAGFVAATDPGNEAGEHTGFGVGNTHNAYQWQMLERAWRGGLRLVVVDVHNSRAAHLIVDGDEEVTGIMGDWQAIDNVIAEMKRLTALPTDPVYFAGKYSGFAQIAYSPYEARQIIAAGKLAIVLGIEIDEIGKERVAGDTPEQQADDLWAMGIRKFDIAHAIDNPYAGTALINTTYLSLNNLLGTDGDPQSVGFPDFTPGFGSGFIREVTNFLPSWFPSPFSKLFIPLVDKEREFPQHWFGLASDTGGWIGFTNVVNYRFGSDNISLSAERLKDGGGGWMQLNDPNVFEMKGRVNTIQILETAAQLTSGASGAPPLMDAMCQLRGQVAPKAYEYLQGRSGTYASLPNHRNRRGLTALGTRFQKRLMELAALISTDHLSQTSRLDAYQNAYDFGAAARIGDIWDRFKSPDPSYPFVGGHTWFRKRTASRRASSRSMRTWPSVNVAYIAEGELSHCKAILGRWRLHLGSRSSDFRQFNANAQTPFLPRNDCDYSSKSFASSYLYAVREMSGFGITPSTDANGFTSPLTSRYGSAGMSRGCRTMFRPEQFAGTRTNAEQIHNKSLAEDDPRLGDPYYDPRIGNAPRDFLAADTELPSHILTLAAHVGPNSTANADDQRPVQGALGRRLRQLPAAREGRERRQRARGPAEQADRHRAPPPGGPHRRRRPRGGRRQGGGRYGAAAGLEPRRDVPGSDVPPEEVHERPGRRLRHQHRRHGAHQHVPGPHAGHAQRRRHPRVHGPDLQRRAQLRLHVATRVQDGRALPHERRRPRATGGLGDVLRLLSRTLRLRDELAR